MSGQIHLHPAMGCGKPCVLDSPPAGAQEWHLRGWYLEAPGVRVTAGAKSVRYQRGCSDGEFLRSPLKL